jgi:hypothetical protein
MTLVGKIPGKGLTPEAAEALNQTSDLTGIDSEAGEANPFEAPITEPLFAEYDEETGDGVDDSRLRQKPQEPPPARDAKPGIPSLDEWMDFFSRIVIRVACDWYIEWAFRGVDGDRLTDREIARIQLSDEERKRIAVPFAELSHKSRFMRKHGRAIVASGGLFDAFIALGTWTSRVNRIARKYKNPTIPGRVVSDERAGSDQSSANGSGYAGANGGRIVDGVTIINPGG